MIQTSAAPGIAIQADIEYLTGGGWESEHRQGIGSGGGGRDSWASLSGRE